MKIHSNVSKELPLSPRSRDTLHGRFHDLAHTPAGAVFLSLDFMVAVPVGVLAGALVAFGPKVAMSASPVLLAVTALLATLAGIVMAAHTILVSLLSSEYLLILEKAPGGVKGVSRPYQIVIWVCAIGVVVSLLAALAWPIVPNSTEWYWRASRWAIFGISVIFGLWGLIGSVQLAGQSAWHLEQRANLLRILRETREVMNQRDDGRRSV